MEKGKNGVSETRGCERRRTNALSTTPFHCGRRSDHNLVGPTTRAARAAPAAADKARHLARLMRRRRGGRGPVALPKPDSPEDRGKAGKNFSRSRSGEFSEKLAGSIPLLDASPVRQCFRPRCTETVIPNLAMRRLRLGNAPSYSPVSRLPTAAAAARMA